MSSFRIKKISMACLNVVLTINLVAGSLAPKDANAALKDALSSMFLVAGTDTQAINTQRLRGFYGGSLSLRSPGRSFDIVQFAAPKIDAGCGGVDLFFGSFSFINGAQFEQLIRSIAANAVGFAVKMAITGMCSPCANILQTLEDAVRDLNALAKNTCAINFQTVMDTGAKMVEHGRKIGEQLTIAANRISDNAASSDKSLSEPPSTTAAGGDSAVAKSNPVIGNMVARAAFQTYDNGANTLRMFMSSKQATELIQSMFGTVIVRPKDQADTNCEGGSSAERCDMPPLTYTTTIGTWDKLMKPRTHSPQGTTILRCIDWNQGCTKIQTETMPLTEWGGVEDYVNMALFGTVTPRDPANYSQNSIIGSFYHKQPLTKDGSNLSASAREMLANIPFPLLLTLMELQKSPGAIRMMGEMITPKLVKYFEYVLAVELLSVANQTFTAQSEVQAPDDFTKKVESFTQQLSSIKPDSNEIPNMLDSAFKLIKQSQTLTGSTVRSSKESR